VDEQSFLAVFAHPDDESFGVGGILRAYSDRGIKTALICATRGEEGEINDPSLATRETLGAVREQELRTACALMGVDDLMFLGYHDGTVAAASRVEAVGKIVHEIRRLRPQVIATFDANGGYGHTDHIAIHAFTLEAFKLAGDPSAYPEQLTAGLKPYTPQKLYYVAIQRSMVLGIRDELLKQGIDFVPGGNMATIPVEQMGTPDEDITTVVTLDDRSVDTKIAAWHAHRTQVDPKGFPETMDPEAARQWSATERFVRAIPPMGRNEPREADLFEGIPA
jgi:LmbE family N-acetylglucosaminyl deacetylase